MPFLNRRDIALKVRTQAEKDYRTQLRAALSTPGLPAEQRVEIQRRLKSVGKPRVYDANSPAPPGAIEFTPPETEASLKGLTKAALVALAGGRGLPTSGTKAVLVGRLLGR
jgi:hypothetical protein